MNNRIITYLIITLLMFCNNAYCYKGVFHKIWLEHNVTHDGVKCLAIHNEFSVWCSRTGEEGDIISYVDYTKGVGHKDTNGRYRTTDGNVCVSRKWKDNINGTRYHDFILYLPNDEIHPVPGNHTYFVRSFLFFKGQVLCHSEFVSFDMAGNKPQPNNNANAYRHVAQRDPNYNYVECSNCHGQKKCPGCHGTRNCNYCSGTGRCSQCNGNKGTNVWSGFNYVWFNCSKCIGRGTCNLCAGSGNCQCSRGSNPTNGYCVICKGEGVVKQPKIKPNSGGNNVIIINQGGGSRGTRINTESAPQQCYSCSGTGRCRSCNGTGFNAYTDTGNCKVCYGNGRCVGCRGTGHY